MSLYFIHWYCPYSKIPSGVWCVSNKWSVATPVTTQHVMCEVSTIVSHLVMYSLCCQTGVNPIFCFNIEVTVKSAVVQNYIICLGWYSWFSLYHFYFQVLIMTQKYLLENDQFSSDRDFRGQLNNVFSLWINSSLIWTIERHIGKFHKWSRV